MKETEEVKNYKRGAKEMKMEDYKGITLIALVVTIVVLLILAGVSISMLGGENGIITQAQEAKENTKKTSVKEEINTAWSATDMERVLNNYSNEEIAHILQSELRKNEKTAEVVWNNSESKYEVYYKGYKETIDINGKISSSIEKILKKELVLIVEKIQDTESVIKLLTISVNGLPEEDKTKIEKILEDSFAEQVNKMSGTNYTYEKICEDMYGEYKTLDQQVEFLNQIIPSLNNISSLFNFIGLEIPDECAVKIESTGGEIYKVIKFNGETIEIAQKNNINIQVNSNRYTSNVIKLKIENDETYSNIYNQKTELEIDGYKVTIPKGFAIGENGTSIGDISTGLVITDSIIENNGKRYSNGNEFVWIPVEINADGNPVVHGTDKIIAKLKEGSTANFEGVLYNFSGTNSSVLTDKNYEEPMHIENGNYGDSSIGLTAEMLQKEYNEMINSIKQYGGFYVSRYELSIEEDEPVSKPGLLPLENRGDSTKKYNWYYMYQKIGQFSNNDLQANMIWGSQYDAMLNFALLGNDKEKVTSKEYGNYTSFNTHYNPLKTGCTPTSDKINNVYDLAGNVREWTLEKYYNESTYDDGSGYQVSKGEKRVVRGGGNLTSTSNSSNRYFVSPSSARGKGDDDSDMGTRFTLYLK